MLSRSFHWLVLTGTCCLWLSWVILLSSYFSLWFPAQFQERWCMVEFLFNSFYTMCSSEIPRVQEASRYKLFSLHFSLPFCYLPHLCSGLVWKLNIFFMTWGSWNPFCSLLWSVLEVGNRVGIIFVRLSLYCSKLVKILEGKKGLNSKFLCSLTWAGGTWL